MNEIIIKNQKEFDAIDNNFVGIIRIIGKLERININFKTAIIIVYDSAVIKFVYDSAVIESVYGSAVIESVSDQL